MEITSISIKVPKENALPDGNYNGLWSGYTIELLHDNKTYELSTKQGIRGMDCPVLVSVENGIPTFKQA